MWVIERFETRMVIPAKRKRLSLDAIDRVLEAMSFRQPPKEPAVLQGMDLRKLLGERDWSNLAAAIRTRFASDPVPGETRLYRGTMDLVNCTPVGRVMAYASWLIGSPMAWLIGINVPCDVLVYQDPAGGVVWERRYDFGMAGPQVARTVKRCDGKGCLLGNALVRALV